MDFSFNQIWVLLAGLGLFLFGMFLLEEALKTLAGRSFKLFLRKNVGSPIKAALSGTIVTVILQSSSLVSLLVMSLAGTGIISLASGIGMIMGANLGTTITGWLVSFIGFKTNIEVVILPFLAIGGLGMAFLKTEKLVNFSKLLMGFSIMFLGLNYMKTSFADLPSQVDLTFLEGKPALLFLAFGVILTALIQSSSASMTIYLTSLASGIISLPQAVFLMIGSDLGTTVTALIGTVNGNEVKKKVGWAQFMFNLINAIFGFILAYYILYIIEYWFKITDLLTSLVLFHTLLNLMGVLIMLPFIRLFTKLLERFIQPNNEKIATYIDLNHAKESIASVEAMEQEAILFINTAFKFNTSVFSSKSKSSAKFINDYFRLKQYENEISAFYVALQQSGLVEQEALNVIAINASVRNASLSAKDLKDIKHNLDVMDESVDDETLQLKQKITLNQNEFYSSIKQMLSNIHHVSLEDIEKLNVLQDDFYREETNLLYELFATKIAEVDTASMLNMIREINTSNESMLKALKHYSAIPKKNNFYKTE